MKDPIDKPFPHNILRQEKNSMTTTQEALKMAIETLELLNEHVYRTGKAYDAIKLCKEALAQEQEPVAWVRLWADGDLEVVPNTLEGAFPVYTHPAKQLSDDEIVKLSHEYDLYHYLGIIDFARALEAKIKGK